MNIEIGDNVIITNSVIRVSEELSQPEEWLKNYDDFFVMHVGGIHNNTMYDKIQWVVNSLEPIRFIEEDTGREEVWFPRKREAPTFISINENGELDSHQKFTHKFSPAVHYTSDYLLKNDWSTGLSAYASKRKVSLWFTEGVLSHVGEDYGIEADYMLFPIKDPNVEYIDYVMFEKLIELWENGKWKGTAAKGFRIVFPKISMNVDEEQNKVKKWLSNHCKHGFYPFGDELFPDKEEEFLFITEFCL